MGWVWVALIALAGYALLRALVIEPNSVEIREKEIALAHLPPELDGLRIAHVSDLHLREVGDRERLVIEAVRRAAPDLLCLTGDFVSASRAIQFLVPFLMELTRGRRAFGVLGNHDYGDDVKTAFLVETLRRCGVEVLVNESRRVVLRGVPVVVAGVDDPHTARDDVQTALAEAGAARDTALVLLLAHSPDVLLREGVGRAGLVLCGHTHGGQLCLPFVGPIVTNTRIGRAAASGVVRIAGTVAHVSRGLGETTWRARFLCRPEVTVLRLTRSRSEP